MERALPEIIHKDTEKSQITTFSMTYLKVTLASLVTNGTIQRVIGQKKLHNTFPEDVQQ